MVNQPCVCVSCTMGQHETWPCKTTENTHSNEAIFKWEILIWTTRFFSPHFLHFTLLMMMVVVMMMFSWSQDFQPAAIFLELDRENFYHLRCRRKATARGLVILNKIINPTLALPNCHYAECFIRFCCNGGFGLAMSSPELVQIGTRKGKKALG